ncbi:MAG: hypothetical protein D8M57_06395 [Candidatus Scalindua sp. AMX11]|nr:MAG: hypothetical protein DWQ00_14000 [Candidatus Scalindua sp.]NOG85407.1 hypothetical protein [Planctomycetota bacterium]RZV84001.1 MAG: hypothetical protein EX341_08695 [Candidatus Scalindua sp. SCAELEC01]TDE65714.1 MAG: hypothetical protein D8M57_06395 [Candidatus Scalindua sp. AMX11]GJQ58795.1 MAG: hypothetical protein SCALA701_15960 [Candidatus Scalindua sp.]
MKKAVLIIVIIVALFAALFICKNFIVKTSLMKGIKAVTGLKLKIKSVDVGLVNTLIGFEELKLFNPPGFVDELMIDMPEIYVDYDLGSFIKGKAHLQEVRLDLREFFVIKNEDGVINLDSLKVVKGTKEKKVDETKKKTEMPELQIDLMKLKVGKVIYKDYTKGTPPKVSEFNVNIDEQYENISDPYALSSLILVTALKKTTIAKLANFNLGPFQDEVRGKVLDVTKKFKETSGTLKEIGQSAEKEVQTTVEKAVESSRDAEKKIGDTAKETVEKATDTFKKILPFGK